MSPVSSRARLLCVLTIFSFLPLNPALITQCLWEPLTALHRQSCSPAVDNALNSNLLFSTPWTHQPFCVDPQFTTKGEKLCVYSVATFNENTGFSLITTPEMAAYLLSTGAVEHGSAAWKYRHFIDHGGRPASLHHSGVPYKIQNIPGKGNGVVATRKIKNSDVIMVSYPAMIVDNDLFPSLFDGGSPPAEGSYLFQRALDQLADQERVTSLAQSWSDKRLHVVDDVIRTNAFGVEINERGHKGLYPEIARMNHGCDPNAIIRFDPGTLGVVVRATKNIEVGEEIHISYIPLGMRQAVRAQALRNWRFDCTCSLCAAPLAMREASDTRRLRLVEIQHTFRAMRSNQLRLTYNEIRSLSEEIIQIAKTERLTANMVQIYQDLTRLWYEIGDFAVAVHYARGAVEFYEAYGDTATEFYEGLRRNLDILEGWTETT